jgi:hypothetical protein
MAFLGSVEPNKAERFVRETVERRSRRNIPNIWEAVREIVEIKTDEAA